MTAQNLNVTARDRKRAAELAADVIDAVLYPPRCDRDADAREQETVEAIAKALAEERQRTVMCNCGRPHGPHRHIPASDR